jgi:hypothetical protein
MIDKNITECSMGVFDDSKSTMGSTTEDGLIDLPEQDTDSDETLEKIEYLKNEIKRTKEAIELAEIIEQEVKELRDLLRDSKN